MNKYFLYVRKSTDVEDKQVLSIEAQIAELRAYARQEKLEIIEKLIEKQGRPFRPPTRWFQKNQIVLSWSGVVDDVGTYWQSSTDYFFIPSLSSELAKIN